ncbi:MAG TPA: UDP-glucuronic acid decarboxylase family protein [Chthonomonadales bacterium]|nr:UDP-glucuronic acid decarboxylase family protein [Chthonomonadales bacterium]
MPRAVVTGGAGFLGSHLCDRLLSEGFEVVVLDNLITGSTDNISHHLGNPRFRFLKYDVTEYLFLDGPVDQIYHLASPASPVDFPTKPIQILKVNALGTHKALGLARAKGARFLLASTSEVYGDPLVHPQTEDYLGNVNPVGIRGVYDEAKRFAESMTMAYHRFHGVPVRIVRIFNTYGERMRLDDGRVVPNFIGQALRGEPITVYGTGRQTRSFCYVSDLIEGFRRLMESEQTGPINIGNPTERTMLEFAEEIRRLSGSASDIVLRPLPTSDDPRQRKPSIDLARRTLGWEPHVSLDEGLTRTIAHFRERLGL